MILTKRPSLKTGTLTNFSRLIKAAKSQTKNRALWWKRTRRNRVIGGTTAIRKWIRSSGVFGGRIRTFSRWARGTAQFISIRKRARAAFSITGGDQKRAFKANDPLANRFWWTGRGLIPLHRRHQRKLTSAGATVLIPSKHVLWFISHGRLNFVWRVFKRRDLIPDICWYQQSPIKHTLHKKLVPD